MTLNNSNNYKTTQYNVIVGSSNNNISNINPSTTLGVPLISQGSSSNPTFGTAVVSGGGTGITSTTSYAVLCAGTSSTGNIQSVSSLGSAGQVLTSNGPGFLPTFQDFSPSGGSGYSLSMQTGNSALSDNSTQYINQALGTSTIKTRPYGYFVIPTTGTLDEIHAIFILGSVGSSENVSFRILKNDVDTTIVQDIQLTASPTIMTATGIGLSVTAGDYIILLLRCPAWVTNPGNTSISVTVVVT